MELIPAQGKDETTHCPEPGDADVWEPRVIVPSVCTVGDVVPGQVTVFVRVTVPVGDCV